MTISLETRLKKRKVFANIGGAYLQGGKFTLPSSSDYTSHHPYSREFYESLESLSFLSRGVTFDFFKEVERGVSPSPRGPLLPIDISPLLRKAFADAFTLQPCVRPTPPGVEEALSRRVMGVDISFSASVEFDISCAVWLAGMLRGWMGGKVINVCEVEPGALLCITLWMPTSLSRPDPMPLHFWISKHQFRRQTTFISPHIGILGGALFDVLCPFLTSLGFRVDYSGGIFARLLVQGQDQEVEVTLPSLLPKIAHTPLASVWKNLVGNSLPTLVKIDDRIDLYPKGLLSVASGGIEATKAWAYLASISPLSAGGQKFLMGLDRFPTTDGDPVRGKHGLVALKAHLAQPFTSQVAVPKFVGDWTQLQNISSLSGQLEQEVSEEGLRDLGAADCYQPDSDVVFDESRPVVSPASESLIRKKLSLPYNRQGELDRLKALVG